MGTEGGAPRFPRSKQRQRIVGHLKAGLQHRFDGAGGRRPQHGAPSEHMPWLEQLPQAEAFGQIRPGDYERERFPRRPEVTLGLAARVAKLGETAVESLVTREEHVPQFPAQMWDPWQQPRHPFG